MCSGPDLIIVDEAHKVKNADSYLTKALRLVVTSRRIALTGSPLQNNLREYYCMVDFVKPKFLGFLKSFKRQFIEPIEVSIWQLFAIINKLVIEGNVR